MTNIESFENIYKICACTQLCMHTAVHAHSHTQACMRVHARMHGHTHTPQTVPLEQYLNTSIDYQTYIIYIHVYM